MEVRPKIILFYQIKDNYNSNYNKTQYKMADQNFSQMAKKLKVLTFLTLLWNLKYMQFSNIHYLFGWNSNYLSPFVMYLYSRL